MAGTQTPRGSYILETLLTQLLRKDPCGARRNDGRGEPICALGQPGPGFERLHRPGWFGCRALSVLMSMRRVWLLVASSLEDPWDCQVGSYVANPQRTFWHEKTKKPKTHEP